MSAEKWTVESFCELLLKHGTLGPYINRKHSDSHVCVDGWLNLENLVAELNEHKENL